jgi:hypothetical protein
MCGTQVFLLFSIGLGGFHTVASKNFALNSAFMDCIREELETGFFDARLNSNWNMPYGNSAAAS